MEFSPSDPAQGYVVTVYESDSSQGEATIPTKAEEKNPAKTAQKTSQGKIEPQIEPEDQGTLMNAGGPS
jgi:hypothetical protein